MNLAILVIFVTNIRMCQSKTYDFFSLYSIVPTEKEHLKFLENLEKQKYLDAYFWRRPSKLHEEVQFIVSPADKDLFLERTHHFRIKTNLLLENVQKAFDEQLMGQYLRLKVETFTWDHYHNLEDINQWLADVALKYPKAAELSSIGKTSEGRDIYVIKINPFSATNKVIVEGGIHGHEWISVEVVTYLINELLHFHKNSYLNDLIKTHVWYLIPVVNPDGFEYTHSTDRLWRKNRRVIGTDIGVDLNRNFDYNFGAHGTSNDSTHDTYCGPVPFSEPESKALAKFISLNEKNLTHYISMHAYGQKILIPYSDRIKHLENFAEMENYGKQAVLKMYKLYGIKYNVGTTYDTTGSRVSGNSESWVKKNFKVRHVFSFLLRDNGTYGHALPATQILATCQEALTGLIQVMTAKPKRVGLDVFRSSSIMVGGSAVLVLEFIIFILKYIMF